MRSATPFIGRVQELNDIQTQLDNDACQLLSIVGPGGMGKTRLALQLVDRIQHRYPDGTAFVPLQPIQSAQFFIPAIAETLQIALSGSESPIEQVGGRLADKNMLIVLDNFEHILEAAEQLVNLIPLAPQVTYLVTSREPLHLQEEWRYPLGGLPFPTQAESNVPLEQYYAVALFCERATRVFPQFEPTQEIEAVRHICQLVDGMPLALELAAVWRQSLTCQDIANEIQHNLDFLHTRLRNVPARHRSIQAIFEQTWEQLDPAGQNVFKRLSIFQGGFQRDAAIKLAKANPVVLANLVDQSLLQLDQNNRYQLHALLRQYAAEKLAQDREEQAQLEAKHAAYYINFLLVRRKDSAANREQQVMTDVRREIDNVRLAWSWAIEQADPALLHAGGDTLGHYYQLAGNYTEGSQQFTQAIDALESLPPSEAVDQALLSTVLFLGWYHLRLGNPAGTEQCMTYCLDIYRRLGIPLRTDYVSDPTAFLAIVNLIKGNYETAWELINRSLTQAQHDNHALNEMFASHFLSQINLGQGQIETARSLALRAYTLAKQVNNEWFRTFILNNLGQIATLMGDLATARTHYQDSYDICQTFDDPQGMAQAAIHLGDIALETADIADAQRQYTYGYELFTRVNDKGGLATTHQGLALAAMTEQDVATAQSHFLQALTLGIAVNFRTFLLTLLSHIAELFWQAGQRERAVSLVDFMVNHEATDHSAKQAGQEQLTRFKLAMSPAGYANASQSQQNQNLTDFCHTLLTELALPIVVQSEEPAEDQPLFDPLTPRELEVLRLMATGRSNPEIARELIVSVGTIKGYTNKIFSKLSVRNRVEAVKRANELQLI